MDGKSTWKWWMTGVLFLATVLTYLDRQTLAICEKMVRDEFHLNDEQYGQLLAAFRWAYALMQVPAGLMADRLPLRTTFGLAVGSGRWPARRPRRLSLADAHGHAGGARHGRDVQLALRSRIVANMFPPSDRSLASGIFNSGAPRAR